MQYDHSMQYDEICDFIYLLWFYILFNMFLGSVYVNVSVGYFF